jgi:hypothetical protein
MLEVSAHQACRRGVPAMARQMRDPSSCTRTGSAALSAYGKREGAAESAGNDCVPAAVLARSQSSRRDPHWLASRAGGASEGLALAVRQASRFRRAGRATRRVRSGRARAGAASTEAAGAASTARAGCLVAHLLCHSVPALHTSGSRAGRGRRCRGCLRCNNPHAAGQDRSCDRSNCRHTHAAYPFPHCWWWSGEVSP